MAMKRAQSAADGRAAVEAYLAGVPEPARTTLQTVRERIRAAAPKAATETISYRMPAFHHHRVLVSYAAFKKHCSFFPMGSSVIEGLADEVKPYRTAKGTLQFPLDKPLPASLIRKIVKARVAQNERKAAR
ncbi:MAG: iron chaperone [Acidobacteriota bacterium]